MRTSPAAIRTTWWYVSAPTTTFPLASLDERCDSPLSASYHRGAHMQVLAIVLFSAYRREVCAAAAPPANAALPPQVSPTRAPPHRMCRGCLCRSAWLLCPCFLMSLSWASMHTTSSTTNTTRRASMPTRRASVSGERPCAARFAGASPSPPLTPNPFF